MPEGLLDSPLFKYGIAALVIVVVGRLVVRALFPPKLLVQSSRVRCPLCGWSGTIGKYNRKCSKCGSTTLEEMKKR